MEYTRYIGWDVHGDTIVMAEAGPGRAPARDLGTIPHTAEAVGRWLRRQPDGDTLIIAYAAGPTGFGLARLCHRHDIACEVIAPGLVPVRPTDRVKTDRRDARQLAVDLRAGQLTPIPLPTPAACGNACTALGGGGGPPTPRVSPGNRRLGARPNGARGGVPAAFVLIRPPSVGVRQSGGRRQTVRLRLPGEPSRFLCVKDLRVRARAPRLRRLPSDR